jgi:hypothetical protein
MPCVFDYAYMIIVKVFADYVSLIVNSAPCNSLIVNTVITSYIIDVLMEVDPY